MKWIETFITYFTLALGVLTAMYFFKQATGFAVLQ